MNITRFISRSQNILFRSVQRPALPQINLSSFFRGLSSGANPFYETKNVIHLREKNRIEATLRASGILGPEKKLEDFLQTNKLADKDESVSDVFTRAVTFLAKEGSKFYGESEEKRFEELFMKHVANFEIILGSPILTNAGRREHKSISACSIPPVKLSKMSRLEIADIVGSYHSRGMGTGFSLDDTTDPVEMVKYLNAVAIGEVQKGGVIERSCGNMGVLSINHPKVIEFIRVKRDNPEIKEWKFNLSVNITEEFIHARATKTPFKLSNGEVVDPETLMQQIAENAHATGDPGIIFMDRINNLNRVPQMGKYETVVPCGEVSLFEGEVCQFAYLNLIRFIDDGMIDKEGLREAVHAMVILLDNAVEANIERMPNELSSQMISSVRRIGIGVCGFAEVLQHMGLPYGSEEGREFAADLMGFINFESKLASILLAKERGPFSAFTHEETRTELFIKPFKNHPTKFISDQDWERLELLFKEYGIRNLATTILPPTGRSSLIAGVTGSIEPPFRLSADPTFIAALKKQCSIYGYEGDLTLVIEEVRKTGSVQNSALPDDIKKMFRTASELTAQEHILMTAAFQSHIDEGISKTVNLSNDSSVEDVQAVFDDACELNLKGITIYRDGCRTLQPKPLSMKSNSNIVIDRIYGPIQVSPRIARLLESPLLTRLKGVHQNGTAYLFDSRQSTTRYEHSLGTLALVQLLQGSESMQVTALLHDLSHTVFSHVVDLIFGRDQQNYHDIMRQRFLSSKMAKQVIKDCGITNEELACELVPLIKGEGLNVDRLDYCIRDLSGVNRIYQPQYSSIVNNLVINERGEMICTNLETARLIFTKFLEVNQEVYFEPRAEATAVAMAALLKRMLELKILTEDDLFTTDDEVIAKILKSEFSAFFHEIRSKMSFSLSEKPTGHIPYLRKLRFIDPQIVGYEGKLTDHCEKSRGLLTTYQSTQTTLYYDIPLLRRLP